MIYRNVKELAEKSGKTVNRVEKEAGLGKGAISKWIDHSPTLASMQSVAKVLGVPVSKLINGETDREKELEEK